MQIPTKIPPLSITASTPEYLGVDMHDTTVWAFNPMYGSDPIYLESFVVGEMVAHQIQHKTDQEFGKKWDKKAGEYLKTRLLLSRGCRGAWIA